MNFITFDHLKAVCNLTDADIEVLKRVIAEIVRSEEKHITVVDYNDGNTLFPAVVRGVNDKGVIVYRKDATIVDNTAW